MFIPMIENGKGKLLFALVQLFFCATTAKMVFTVLFLQEKGLSNTTIGLIFSINALLVIFMQPVWGYITDRLQARKQVLLLCFSMATILYSLLLTTSVPLWIGIILAMVSFFECAIASILDVWMLSFIGSSYGAVRLWGSVGFSGAVLLFSQTIGEGSISAMFPIYLIIAGITLIAFILLVRSTTNEKAKAEERSHSPMSARVLLQNVRYLLLLCFIFMLYLPNAPATTFLPNLFQLAGGTVEQYGFSNSLKAVAEIPAFLFGALLLRRFGHVAIIFLASGMYFMVQLLFSIAQSPVQVALGQILQGPAYSLLLLGTLTYVFELAPKDMRMTAQTLVNAIGMGLAAIVGNYGGGLFIDHFGLKPLYWAGMVLIATAMLAFSLFFILDKRNKNQRLPLNT